ncbi:MAG: hypothetical protein NPMRD2_600006 [Nitrosopumilales archaeon]|nr:MAG: hypothetical protein NPMRD2_600006 [Nitrosopumilales archaeon]
MEKIEYNGTVWAIDHNNPKPLVEHSVKKLQEYGINNEDIVLTDAPENVKVEAIVVEIWPHHLEVGRVRTIRNESFISGTVMTIELKTDAKGNYI